MKKEIHLLSRNLLVKLPTVIILLTVLVSIAGCKEKEYRLVIENQTDFAINSLEVELDLDESYAVPALSSSNEIKIRARKPLLGLVRSDFYVKINNYSDLTGNHKDESICYVSFNRLSKKHINTIVITLADNPVANAMFTAKLQK